MDKRCDMSRAFTKAFVPPLPQWATGNPCSGFPRSQPPIESAPPPKLILKLWLRMILPPELVDEILFHLRRYRTAHSLPNLGRTPARNPFTPASSSPIRHAKNGEKLRLQRVRNCCDTFIYVACSNPFTTSMRVISSYFITFDTSRPTTSS